MFLVLSLLKLIGVGLLIIGLFLFYMHKTKVIKITINFKRKNIKPKHIIDTNHQPKRTGK